jgi:hypothetical protein
MATLQRVVVKVVEKPASAVAEAQSALARVRAMMERRLAEQPSLVKKEGRPEDPLGILV